MPNRKPRYDAPETAGRFMTDVVLEGIALVATRSGLGLDENLTLDALLLALEEAECKSAAGSGGDASGGRMALPALRGDEEQVTVKPSSEGEVP